MTKVKDALNQEYVFTYDALGRLLTQTKVDTTASFEYDTVGNRTSSHLSATYGYQPFNRLTSTSTANHTYDNNGNLTSKSNPIETWYYYYDRENRLLRATKFGISNPLNRSVIYQYDALGRRVVQQEKRTGRTEFTLDEMDVIQDRKSDETITNYVNGLGIDNKLKVSSGTTSKYFLTDHLGSTIGMSDSNGIVTESAIYDSFGNKITSNLTTRYQYTGREYDEYTGLMFYRARFYDPQIGRFTSEDPIGFEGGDVNLYGYVGNNPIKFNDPTGLSAAGIVIIALTIIEASIHGALFIRAMNLYPDSCDPKGRKKHCYVNCMSTRLHFGNTGMANIFSLGQEAGTLVPAIFRGRFKKELDDSLKDMRANIHGQSRAIFVWRSCYSMCMEYPE